MSLFLILLAAGDSKRLKSSTPKPFHYISNKTLIEHSLKAFENFRQIKKIVVVYNRKHKKYINKIDLKYTLKVIGGKSRQESTFKALSKIRNMNCKKVLIHDCARPYPTRKLISEVINKLQKNHAVVPLLKAHDATKRVKKNMIFKNIERNSLRFSQTPQGFTFKKIYEKHEKYINENFDDDSSLFIKDGDFVKTVTGSKKNLKITDEEDLNIFKSFKRLKSNSGIGFDIHRLVKDKKLYLGGIKIPYPLGLEGHSDGDVVIHSLIDALLGACKLGDIGKLFSDRDKKYKNIRSTKMLEKTINLINSKNFYINNIDINIITQKPKIKKYSKKMLKTLSKICKIPQHQINIKGKTTEKLGLIGKEKAIASEVIVTVNNYE